MYIAPICFGGPQETQGTVVWSFLRSLVRIKVRGY
jgi:hypothetical protein